VPSLPDLPTVAAVCGIVFVAAVLQRTVGFGLALLAVPLLTFAVPAKTAVVLTLLVGTATSAWMLLHLRDAVEPEPARRLGIGAVVGAPVGVVVLRVIAPDGLRLLVGVTTCVAAAWIIGSSRRGRVDGPAAPRWRPWALGVASGVLATSVGTNGPPVVYELRRRALHGDAFRATVSAVFVLTDLVALPLLAGAGLLTASTVVLGAVSLVPCAAGMAAGGWVSRRMEPAQFVWAADLLLLATGVATIARALA
jgi:uncharacterized protein